MYLPQLAQSPSLVFKIGIHEFRLTWKITKTVRSFVSLSFYLHGQWIHSSIHVKDLVWRTWSSLGLLYSCLMYSAWYRKFMVWTIRDIIDFQTHSATFPMNFFWFHLRNNESLFLVLWGDQIRSGFVWFDHHNHIWSPHTSNSKNDSL